MSEPLSHKEKPVDILILAAGLGTRMKSHKAKVLHTLDGRPLIAHVSRTAAAISSRKICIVVGHQEQQVRAAVEAELGKDRAIFATQPEQRGTGDAVMAARSQLGTDESTLLILSGDVPLVKTETLCALIQSHRERTASCTMLTVRLENPRGYGRIVRDESDRLVRIVEQSDASTDELQIREINAGIYCFQTRQLFDALTRLQPNNKQGEYYLTDVPGMLSQAGEPVHLYLHSDAREVAGVNTRAELAEFENLLRRGTIRRLMLDGGVTFIDPSHAYVSSEAQIGWDCVISPDVHIEGQTVIGEACEIHQGTRITNSRIGHRAIIKDHCVIVDSEVADDCVIGPFAHLRMNARMEERSVVGNFVEMKKSRLGRGSKSMHLTYLGDASIGEQTNIGAGTVTCNYDGQQKHETIIEDHVKIGSDTMLVAPVRVGSGAVTGAGSVVTDDVPPDTLVAGVPAKVKKNLKAGKSEKSAGK
jgi:bifunctional UDP-N-acetylglucosamine pyrophosphorylase/glucosamine-1-phosphate N-acetyltransferase